MGGLLRTPIRPSSSGDLWERAQAKIEVARASPGRSGVSEADMALTGLSRCRPLRRHHVGKTTVSKHDGKDFQERLLIVAANRKIWPGAGVGPSAFGRTRPLSVSGVGSSGAGSWRRRRAGSRRPPRASWQAVGGGPEARVGNA